MSEEFDRRYKEAFEEHRVTIQPITTKRILIQAIDTLQDHDNSHLGKQLTDDLIKLFESITGEIYEDAKKEFKDNLIKEMIRLEKYTDLYELENQEKDILYFNELTIASLLEMFKFVCEKTLG